MLKLFLGAFSKHFHLLSLGNGLKFRLLATAALLVESRHLDVGNAPLLGLEVIVVPSFGVAVVVRDRAHVNAHVVPTTPVKGDIVFNRYVVSYKNI